MDQNSQYRVLRLVVSDYMRLRAVDVTPQRYVQVVAGRNAAGKTSLLSAIAAALGGKRQAASQPVRKGAESSEILCVLGDDPADKASQLLVRRTFTPEGKTALEITAAGGFKAPSPQAILDSLCGKIAFDPLSFTRMEDAEQLETLRKLVGLDFGEADARRKQLYDERTATNKTAKQLAAQAAGIVVAADTPPEEVSVAELMAEQGRRRAKNRENEYAREKVGSHTEAVSSWQHKIAATEKRIAELEACLVEARTALESQRLSLATAEEVAKSHAATVAVLEDADVGEIDRQIIAAGTVNLNVGRVRAKADLEAKAAAAVIKSKELTVQLDAIDADKEQQLATVKWPVEGLGFSDSGVTYQGLPFSQASGAEQLKVSFAMAAALNPKLKIALVRDASLLDEQQMALVDELAAKWDTQCWLEVVDTEAGPAGILIEDGTVVAGGNPVAVQPPAGPKRRGRKPAAETVAPEPPVAEAVTAPWEDPPVSLPGQKGLFESDPSGF